MSSSTLKLRVFLNGDKNSNASNVVVQARGLSFTNILDRITQRMNPPFGVVYRLYRVDGTPVKDTSDLVSNEFYVASGKRPFKAVPYKVPAGKGPAKPSASTSTRSKTSTKTGGPVILVAKNGSSHAPTRIPLPKSRKYSLDNVLDIIVHRLSLPAGSAAKLYSAEGALVSSPSDLQEKHLYVVCGRAERFQPLPYELWKAAAPDLVKKAVKREIKVEAKITTSKFEQLEAHFKGLIKNKRQMDSLWRALDFNGNGIVSLAEIDKLVSERYPLLRNAQALMRAYRQTTINDGDGDAWVERAEFGALLRNIFYFNKLFAVFEKMDSDGDDRIDLDEFKTHSKELSLTLSPSQLEQEFAIMDKNHGGKILFDEFCAWVARNACPVDGEVVVTSTQASSKLEMTGTEKQSQRKRLDRQADIDTTRFDKVEKKLCALLASADEIAAEWRSCDYNGNGICSLAEIDKWVTSRHPELDSKPALMRAYKMTTLVDGDGDAWVEKAEFPALIRNVLYFNKLFAVFGHMDKDGDRRLDFSEFWKGIKAIGLSIPKAEAEAEFAFMDMNDGGVVLFDEFCAYVARKAVPVDGEAVTRFTRAEKRMGVSKGTSSGRGKSAADATEAQLLADTLLARFATVEDKFRDILSSQPKLRKAWDTLDYNNNGIVSLAEIDKWTVERYPVLNHKPALLRAYKATTMKDGNGDAWVDKKEFPALLRNLLYFVKVFTVYNTIDKGQDRRLNLQEFLTGKKLLSMEMSDAEAEEEFAEMDRNHGGVVLFDEFCLWVASKECPAQTDFAGDW